MLRPYHSPREDETMEPMPAKPRNVFTNRNFNLAFWGAFVSNIGNILFNFAVSFYILEITGNNALIQGLYLATGGIVFAVVVLFGGVISDRFHKGKIMFLCDYAKGFLIIALTLVLMLAVQSNDAKVVLLFVIAVLGNAIAAIFSPAASSLLPHIVPEESFQQAQSYYSLMSSFQGILGIVLAGALYGKVSIYVLFFVVGGCYVLSGVSEMFIRYAYVKPETKLTVKTAFQDLGGAFQYLRGMKPILYLMIAVLFINFFFSPVFSNFAPYFIATDLASSEYLFQEIWSPQMWSSMFSVALSVGSIIMAVFLSTRKRAEKIHKGLSISFLSASLLLLAFALFYVLFFYKVFNINVFLVVSLVLLFFLGAAIVSINIPTSATMLAVVDKDKLGKVNSLIDVGSQGLVPLAEFLGGLAITSFGTWPLLVISASGFFLVTLFIILNGQIRKI